MGARILISLARVRRMRSFRVRKVHVALQTCESEASIRHTVVALGALDKQPSHHGRTGHFRRSSTDTAGQHYCHALKEYTKAIVVGKSVVGHVACT
jgi:hypothetical protein